MEPSVLQTAPCHRPGTTFGHYRILEKIGDGGMGVVYKAEDTKLGRIVALKFLAGSRSPTPEALEQFRWEARAASALNHPNVCVIYDIEDVEGEQCIAMEFVEGRTLADLLGGQPLDVDRVVSLGSQIAEALAIAHRRGIVHRDIKPANVLVTVGGVAKVLDFGLAKLQQGATIRTLETRSAPMPAIVGTLPYMAPEQLRGGDVDHRADVFALGVVLYEMATGQRPFAKGTVPDVIDQILNRQPVPPQQLNRRIPRRLARIIDGCLEKEAERRYSSAEAVAAALRRLPVEGSGRVRKARRLTFAAATLLALVVAGASWLPDRAGDRQPPPWEQLTDFPDSATSPALSRDGRLLTFIRGASTFVGSGEVYIKTLAGGDPRQLTDDGREKQDPLFSPDGSTIVYTTGPVPVDIWSIPVAGGRPTMMMRNASTLTWTGNGRLLFSEVRGAPHMAVVTTDSDRRNARDVYVPSRASGMAHRAYLSPDEKWVLIAEMDTSGTGWLPCRLVPFDGSSAGGAIGPPGAPCTSAGWSPDGSWMYMSAAAGGSYHIWRQRFPRGDIEQVTFGPTQEEGIAMAPDGHSLITSVGTAQSSLSLRDATGERRVASEATVTFPRFSRNSRTLFYIAVRQLRDLDRLSGELWAVDVASGSRERVMPGLQVVTYDISPDDARVAVTALDAQGRSHLWLAPVDRHEAPARVEWPAEVVDAKFDGAGNLFLRVRETTGDFVHFIDGNAQSRRKVVSDQVAGLLAVSPSGKWVLVRASLPGRPVSSPGIVAYPVDGGSPVAVFDTMWPGVSWTPDGKDFLVRLGGTNGNAFAIASVALSQRGELPPLPPGGLKTAADAANLPGARIVTLPVIADSDVVAVATTADLSTVAIVRTAVHRNLYRVPLP